MNKVLVDESKAKVLQEHFSHFFAAAKKYRPQLYENLKACENTLNKELAKYIDNNKDQN